MKILGEFQRSGDVIERRFTGAERRMLANLTRGVVETMAAAEDPASAADPVLRRLLPDGHRGDPEIAADYRELTEASLRSGKADDLATMRASLPPDGGEVRLDPDQAAAWLRTSNDLRLALGTRLDVTEDTEPPEDLTDDDDQQLALYYWLTALQGSLVDALAAARGGRR